MLTDFIKLYFCLDNILSSGRLQVAGLNGERPGRMRSIFFMVLIFAHVLASSRNINLYQGLYFDGEPGSKDHD
jgi:hypothetical protein